MKLLEELLTAQKQGDPVALATIIKASGSVPRHAGTKMLIYENGRISSTIGGGEMEARVVAEARQALLENKPRTLAYNLVDPQDGDPGVCGGQVEIYIEPYAPPLTLFVIGCGHVGRALADLAHWLGFYVVVTDDREALATPDNIPHADLHLPGDIEAALETHPAHRQTYIAVVTRNTAVDRQILPILSRKAAVAPYIGVMGSRRRWEHTKKLLTEDGMSAEAIACFRSPLGLPLNAESPKEIAISVLGEIIENHRKKG